MRKHVIALNGVARRGGILDVTDQVTRPRPGEAGAEADGDREEWAGVEANAPQR